MLVKKLGTERLKTFQGPIDEVEFDVNRWLKKRCDDGLIEIFDRYQSIENGILTVNLSYYMLEYDVVPDPPSPQKISRPIDLNFKYKLRQAHDSFGCLIQNELGPRLLQENPPPNGTINEETDDFGFFLGTILYIATLVVAIVTIIHFSG